MPNRASGSIESLAHDISAGGEGTASVNKPLLSIVIATRNRIPYCINAIESILNYPNQNFELIVQDNSVSLELKEYVYERVIDPRLDYAYTSPPFSSIDNFNAALERANGEFVCLIGDDDGVCPNIFEVAQWARENGVDSVCPKYFIDYYWPDAFRVGSPGYFAIPHISKTVKTFVPREAMGDLLADGIIDYMKYDLPKLYHGLVRRSCLETIRKLTGHFIGGLSPDIYASISLAYSVKKHVVIGFPISISGACNVSTTVAGQKGGHSGKLENAPHFRDRGEYVWEKEIPYYYSVQTIWAETALKSFKEMNSGIDTANFNLSRLVAKSIFTTPIHISFFLKKAMDSVKLTNQNLIAFYLKFLYHLFEITITTYVKKIVNRTINKFFRKSTIQSRVPNIFQAVELTKSHINNFKTMDYLNKFSERKEKYVN